MWSGPEGAYVHTSPVVCNWKKLPPDLPSELDAESEPHLAPHRQVMYTTQSDPNWSRASKWMSDVIPIRLCSKHTTHPHR